MIAFCPDQLGPSVYRQLDDPSQYDMITFPRRTGPQIVDWVDYADAVHGADPSSFANYVLQKAGRGHQVWLVWQPMYQTYSAKCEQLRPTSSTRPRRTGAGDATS